MFKTVEPLIEEFAKIADKYVKMNERFEQLEADKYDLEDDADKVRADLEKNIEKILDKAEKVDEQRCKCCDSVLNRAVINHKEIADKEKELYAKVDSHPRLKRIQDKIKQNEKEYDKLDEELSKVGDTLYEYEGKIRDELNKMEKDGFWFNFHTNLI
jgi:DNA repair exonuclease SbcCD ATPase subunit